MNFTKLDSGIIHSSIWSEDAEIRIVWISLLAMAGPDGIVQSSIPGLAHAARVSIPKAQEALTKFLSPDPWSRTKDFEGRRIEEVDGGWRLLNYQRIRDDRAEYQRDYMRQYRAEGRDKSRPVNSGKPSVNTVSGGKLCEPGKPIEEEEEGENILPARQAEPSPDDFRLAAVAASEGSEDAQKPRPRNELFDELVRAEGGNPAQVTKSAASGIGKALSEIKDVTPDVTPKEIRRRAEIYRQVMPAGTTVTAHALAKHWPRCDRAPQQQPVRVKRPLL